MKLPFLKLSHYERIFLANPFPAILLLASNAIHEKPNILIITIAFNNLETIIFQSEQLSKYLMDKHQYIVCDNSTNKIISQKIRNYCNLHKIGYIRLYGNPHNGHEASRSHAISLNWAYRHIIKPSSVRYFGVIDHDIFPIKNTTIIDKLGKSGVYGHLQQRGKKWYLWPGFSFFDKKFLGTKKIDFSPVKGLDTGGANWASIYRHIRKSSLETPIHTYIKYLNGEVVQNTSVERIGDWLHLMNASGWKDGMQKSGIKSLISKVLRKNRDNTQ